MNNLGVYFDTSLTVERQVNAISKACYYQTSNIGHIRRYIILDTCKTSRLDYGNALLYGLPSTLLLSVAKTIATALITRTLDYCNFLLYNIVSKVTLKPQFVLKCLAWVSSGILGFRHSVSLLKSLYWLPVQFRIIFKLCTIAYQTLSSG